MGKRGKRMSGFFFSGSHTSKLDEKGRFVLPQEMRFGLVENGKCEFSIGLGLGGCLTIYKQSHIQKIVAKFQQHQYDVKFQKFFTVFFSTLYQTECDKVGRISIPSSLKKAVGIDKDVTICGVMDKIEIWASEVYDANLLKLLSGESEDFDLAKMTQEAFSLLQEPKAEPEETVEKAVSSVMNPLFIPS